MSTANLSSQLPTWRQRLEQTFLGQEPFIGHPLKPLPLRDNPARTERVSAFVEIELFRFLEEYSARMGSRSMSEAIRRLVVIGAIVEGYETEDKP